MVGEDMIHTEWCPTDFTEGTHRFHRFMQMRFSLFHTEFTDILLELHVYKHEQQAQSVGYRTDL